MFLKIKINRKKSMINKMSTFYIKVGSAIVLLESTLEPEARGKLGIPTCVLLGTF